MPHPIPPFPPKSNEPSNPSCSLPICSRMDPGVSRENPSANRLQNPPLSRSPLTYTPKLIVCHRQHTRFPPPISVIPPLDVPSTPPKVANAPPLPPPRLLLLFPHPLALAERRYLLFLRLSRQYSPLTLLSFPTRQRNLCTRRLTRPSTPPVVFHILR